MPKLFVTSDDPSVIAVVEILKGARIPVTVTLCPPSSKNMYRMPFLQDAIKGRFFGYESIGSYIARIPD